MKTIGQLADLLEDAVIIGNRDTVITGIEHDSRKVQQGTLFVCIPGVHVDGHKFIPQAVAAGASAIVTTREDVEVPQGIAVLRVKELQPALDTIVPYFHDYPARKMRVVGITGTNGKTTTSYITRAILRKAGYKVGLIGTIQIMIEDEVLPIHNTTPDVVELQHTLAMMRDKGMDYVVMEVSSHALDQNRVAGIEFDTAVFTNLTQDHLDYHKTFDNYLAAKKILFLNAKKAVVNVDDPYADRIMEGLSIPILTFGVRDRADLSATNIDITTRGVQFDLHTPVGDCRMNLPIPGLFSVFNAMGSVGLALSIGLPLDRIKEGLESMTSVSGRLEPVSAGKNVPFSVFVDYAHTPDALENVLKTIREFAKRRVICVFGCGGNRDRAKRPIMGEIAGRFSDLAIITSDNPRNENPMDIIDTIEEGVKRSGTHYLVIENRRDAIAHALELAEPEDVVLIAGKGHENYQEINGTKYHFDDKEIVEELLRKRV